LVIISGGKDRLQFWVHF